MHTELGARADKGADVPAVPAVGEQDTFTAKRPSRIGVKGGSAVFKTLRLGMPPPHHLWRKAPVQHCHLLAHKRHQENITLTPSSMGTAVTGTLSWFDTSGAALCVCLATTAE